MRRRPRPDGNASSVLVRPFSRIALTLPHCAPTGAASYWRHSVKVLPTGNRPYAGTSGHLGGPAVCTPGAFPWTGVDPAIAADRGPMAVFSSTFQPHTAIITAATSLYDDSFALPLQSASKPVHLQSRHRRFGVPALQLFTGINLRAQRRRTRPARTGRRRRWVCQYRWAPRHQRTEIFLVPRHKRSWTGRRRSRKAAWSGRRCSADADGKSHMGRILIEDHNDHAPAASAEPALWHYPGDVALITGASSGVGAAVAALSVSPAGRALRLRVPALAGASGT